MSRDRESADEPSLFVAFTKSDMLIKDSNDNVRCEQQNYWKVYREFFRLLR